MESYRNPSFQLVIKFFQKNLRIGADRHWAGAGLRKRTQSRCARFLRASPQVQSRASVDGRGRPIATDIWY